VGQWARRVVLIAACVGAIAACSPFGDDIDAVKEAETAGMRNEEFVQRLAGDENKIEWSARRWEQYPKNSSLIFVEAAMEKQTRDGKTHKIVVQYVYNRVSESTDLHDVLVDGQSQGILGGALRMLLLQLE
jgi:hypothetical protein